MPYSWENWKPGQNNTNQFQPNTKSKYSWEDWKPPSKEKKPQQEFDLTPELEDRLGDITPDMQKNIDKLKQQYVAERNNDGFLHNLKNDYSRFSNRLTKSVLGFAGIKPSEDRVLWAIKDGRSIPNEDLMNIFKPKTTYDKVLGGAGEIAGLAAPLGASYKVADKGLKSAKFLGKLMNGTSKASKIGQTALKGATAGGLYGTVEGIGQGKSAGDTAKNAGEWALIGAIGDPLIENIAAPLIKKGYQSTIGRLLKDYKANKINKEQLVQEISKLDEQITKLEKEEAIKMAQNKNYRPPKPITPFNETIGKELNKRAGIDGSTPVPIQKEVQVPNLNINKNFSTKNNYADQQLKQLFDIAKKENLPPGRERETLEGIWSRIAKEDAGSLDQLINESTQTTNISQLINRLKQGEKFGYYPLDNISKKTISKTVFENPQANFTMNNPIVPLPKKPSLDILKNQRNELFNQLPSKLKKNINNPINLSQTDNILSNKEVAAGKETKTVDDVIANSDNWKDKNAFALSRETMERNFEDIMGKDAPKMIEKYISPIKKSETNRIGFLNKLKDSVKKLRIKPKSEEDKLIQLYGEGVENGGISLEELKQKAPNNWQQIKQKAEYFRNEYDKLLNQVNKVLTRNGYEPIPKRNNYFPHYNEVDNLLNKFGINTTDYTLPTDINGLTADLRPGKNFVGNFLERKGNKTTYGATEGFDRYIEAVSKVIHHTDNIKNLRELDKTIRSKYKDSKHLSNFVADLTEFTNKLAGKNALIDRGVEKVIGRKVYNVLDTLKQKTGLNMLGANVGSAMTQFIPITQAMATTDKKAFIKGMLETLGNIFKRDGFIQKSDFLTRREGTDPLVRNAWDKTIEGSMWLLKAVDKLVSETIVRGKYYEGIKKGLSSENAMKQADDWASRIMADRSFGSQPTLFNSKALGIVSQFQLEVNNQMSFIFKDIIRNSKNKKAMASSLGQVFLYSYFFNQAYEKIVGRKPAFDPIGVALGYWQDSTNPQIEQGSANKDLIDNVLNQLPFTSIVSGGRYPIQAALPDVKAAMTGESTWGEEMINPLVYLISPTAGGQIKKTIQGLTALDKNPLSPQNMPGEYQENTKGEQYLKYPIKDDLANNLRGVLFGKYSFPEAKEYYKNDRRGLSTNQTKQFENLYNLGKDTQKPYNEFQVDRRINTLIQKLNNLKKDRNLSNDEKKDKAEELKQRITELRKLKKEG